MKIGFMAMSGLRLCKAELLELGLTFPGVARRKQAIEALPSLGLLTLAGMTPDKIDMQYLEVRDVSRDELPRDFDAVAISSLTATAREAYVLAARFRKIGTKVILGGLHVSLVPDDAAASVRFGQRADAAIRIARVKSLSAFHCANTARLSLALRILRGLNQDLTDVQGEACAESDRRNPPPEKALARSVRRVRG